MSNLPRVGNGIIDIWSWSLDRSLAEISRFCDTFSLDESLRATRFIFEKDAMRFSTARGLLRMILSHYLSIPAAAVAITTNAHGKPQLAPSMCTELQFNLSHSGNRAVMAVCDSFAVGIDIEEVRAITEDVAGHFFSRWECAALNALPEEDYVQGFFRCWTRKEAFVKALGMGLTHPLDSFDVTVASGTPPRLERLEGDPKASESWTLLDIEVPPGFAGALAVSTMGEAVQLRYQPLARVFLKDVSLED